MRQKYVVIEKHRKTQRHLLTFWNLHLLKKNYVLSKIIPFFKNTMRNTTFFWKIHLFFKNTMRNTTFFWKIHLFFKNTMRNTTFLLKNNLFFWNTMGNTTFVLRTHLLKENSSFLADFACHIKGSLALWSYSQNNLMNVRPFNIVKQIDAVSKVSSLSR